MLLSGRDISSKFEEVFTVSDRFRKFRKRLAALCLSAAFAVGTIGVDASAAEKKTASHNIVLLPESGSSYSRYLSRYPDVPRPETSVYVDNASYSTSLGASCELLSQYEGIPNTIHWTTGGAITFPIEVLESGMYDLELVYRTSSKDSSELTVSVLIDGTLRYDEAERVHLDKYWKNKTGNIQYDSEHKNQIRPTQVVCDEWITYTLRDTSSFSCRPLSFYLTEGEHFITLQGATSDLYIGTISFTNTAVPKPYSEIKPTTEQIEGTPALSNGEAILVEAEVPAYTNSPALQPTREPNDYLASPAHPTNLRFNTIGGTLDSAANVWDKPSQKAVYEVTVPSDGYYSINLRCRRNSTEGFASYRRITVNGTVPCKELDSIRIDYSPKWQTINVTDAEGEPIYFYLEKGANTIAIEAVTGDSEAIADRCEQIASRLHSAVCENSATVDLLREITAELDSVNADIKDNYDVKLSGISRLSTELKAVVKSAEKNPDNLSLLLSAEQSEVNESVTQLVSEIRSLHYQPLELDYFEIKTAHEEYRRTGFNIFKAIVFAFRSFIGSFSDSDNSLSNVDKDRIMDVWVCLDKKQTEIVRNIVNKQYNPTHDVKINIKSDNDALYDAVISGKGPEIALYADADLICTLWERGATVNIHEIQDFGEVYGRFPEGLSQMYSHNDEVHAVPLTNSFPMLFYRSDILSELELTAPQTWDEFAEVMSVISENGYETPMISSETVNNGFKEGDIFLSMLTQAENKSPDSENAVAAFVKWAELCRNHPFSENDTFASFRTGETPVVIADYSSFSAQLSDNAYELTGRWSVAHIPGTYRTVDGVRALDCSANAASLGAVIFDECENVSVAWEFVSWFSSDEVQLQLLNAFGADYYSPANTGIISNKSWTEAEFREIVTQRNSTLEIHNISTSEELKNAVYSALERTLQGEDPRTAYLDELNRHGVTSAQHNHEEG